jgi:hypothetical protein
VYLIVLSCTAIVGILGLASLYAVRVQGRTSQIYADAEVARDCAQSAAALGMLMIAQDPNWRTDHGNGLWVTNKPLGRGTLSVQVVDPEDGSLSDDPAESVALTGIGACGVCSHKAQAVLVADVRPLAGLSACLCAGGSATVLAGKQITLVGGSLSTNGQLNNDGWIDGDAKAATVNHAGTVTGTLTTPAPATPLPDSSVVSRYMAKATAIPYYSLIELKVLGPGRNPWGNANSEGVYYLNTSDRDITIRNSRIYGTLVVDCGNHTLTLDTAVLMQPYRTDYPVLIVRGNLQVKIDSCSTVLDEWTLYKNFNPSGAPYEGYWDSDYSDTYPNEIRGLVHVIGNVQLKQTSRINGALLCTGTVACTDASRIIHDSGLVSNPPQGYTYVAGMKLSPSSFKQVVN